MEAKFDRTNNSFFLAGRAGTGKTTFLKNVQNGIKKKFMVLAPTGQAAINAGGFYYSGKKASAEEMLRNPDLAWLDNNLLGLYILGRCLEDKEQWAELEDVFYRMLAIFNSERDMGQDSITFRKLKYRLAILNERQYGDPGIGVIRSLISENPSYDKYHIALRWMLWKHPDIIKAYKAEDKNEPDGKLVESLLDPNTCEQEFLKQLKAARAEKNSDWNSYRHLINGLKLQMAF